MSPETSSYLISHGMHNHDHESTENVSTTRAQPTFCFFTHLLGLLPLWVDGALRYWFAARYSEPPNFFQILWLVLSFIVWGIIAMAPQF